jgi:hypothetical protein
MSYLKGQVGVSLVLEPKKKKYKPLNKNEKWGSAKAKCPQCKNSVLKYTKIIEDKKFCLRCFINYNRKVEMV